MALRKSCRWCMAVGLGAGLAAFCVLLAILVLRLPLDARPAPPVIMLEDAGPKGQPTANRPLADSPSIVLVHDAYDWINRGGYRNDAGEHCCGKDDCHQVSPAYVLETREGWRLLLEGITVPHAQTFKSEDGKYWACWAGTRLRCFFAPTPDS